MGWLWNRLYRRSLQAQVDELYALVAELRRAPAPRPMPDPQAALAIAGLRATVDGVVAECRRVIAEANLETDRRLVELADFVVAGLRSLRSARNS